MHDYRTFLDRLADLAGATVSVYVGGERSGAAPVAVIRGVAGKLTMSHGWAGDDELSSVAFLPLDKDSAPGSFGPPGLLFNAEIYEQGSGNARTLLVRLGGVDFNIVRED
jgi:hypothetical protein